MLRRQSTFRKCGVSNSRREYSRFQKLIWSMRSNSLWTSLSITSTTKLSMTKENIPKMFRSSICPKRSLTFCWRRCKKCSRTRSLYFNLKLLSRYSAIFTVSTAICSTCLKKWPTRISRTNKIKFWAGISDICSSAITSTEASKVARSSVSYSLWRHVSQSKWLCCGKTTRVKQSQGFMDFSMRSREDTNYHSGKHSTIVSTICL